MLANYLKKTVKSIKQVVKMKHVNLPIIENIYISKNKNCLELYATDLSAVVISGVNDNSEGKIPDILVNFDLLNSVVGKISNKGNIDIEYLQSENKLKINGIPIHCEPLYQINEFPVQFPYFPYKRFYLDTDIVSKLYNYTSKNEGRIDLRCAKLNQDGYIATDGQQMAICKKQDFDADYFIDNKTIDIIKKISPIKISMYKDTQTGEETPTIYYIIFCKRSRLNMRLMYVEINKTSMCIMIFITKPLYKYK